MSLQSSYAMSARKAEKNVCPSPIRAHAIDAFAIDVFAIDVLTDAFVIDAFAIDVFAINVFAIEVFVMNAFALLRCVSASNFFSSTRIKVATIKSSMCMPWGDTRRYGS